MQFLKKITFILCLSIIAIPTTLWAAQYQAGVDYEIINPAQPSSNKDQIEVIEIFSYSCPHCFKFQPDVEEWLEDKPENVKFSRLQVMFRPEWKSYAKLYYTAEALGILEEAHQAAFIYVHQRRKALDNESQIQKFFEEQGVDAVKFKKTFNSFGVESKTKRAIRLVKKLGIKSTPTVVVNGKYRVGPGKISAEKVFDVVNYLIAKESKNLKK